MPVGTKGTVWRKENRNSWVLGSRRTQSPLLRVRATMLHASAHPQIINQLLPHATLQHCAHRSFQPRGFSAYCTIPNTVKAIGIGEPLPFTFPQDYPFSYSIPCSYEEVMDVKRRDGVRLRFNELVHMVFTGEGRDMSWKEHDSENASKIEVVQSGRSAVTEYPASCRSWMVSQFWGSLVVFHFVSLVSFWFGCWVVWVVVVLFFVFSGDTLIFVSPFLSSRGIANQTRCIDDRLSFERARHRQKKKL